MNNGCDILKLFNELVTFQMSFCSKLNIDISEITMFNIVEMYKTEKRYRKIREIEIVACPGSILNKRIISQETFYLKSPIAFDDNVKFGISKNDINEPWYIQASKKGGNKRKGRF